MTQIEVTVIDDNELFRAGLVSLLSQMGFAGVEEATSVGDLIATRRDKPPDIVVSALPDGLPRAIDTMRRIQEWAPKPKVVFLAEDIDLETLSGCYGAGASGYLLKNISRHALAESLKLVSAGETVFPSRLAPLLAGLAGSIDVLRSNTCLDAFNLTDREIAVLRCLMNGQSNKVIAAALHIGESTVKLHLKSILKKTGARNRTQAAIWAADRCRVAPNRGALTALAS